MLRTKWNNYLNNAPVVEIIVVWIFIKMRHGHAVQLSVGESVNKMWLQAVFVVMVAIEGLLELFGRSVTIGLGHQPLDAGFLSCLLDLQLIPVTNLEKTSRRHFGF